MNWNREGRLKIRQIYSRCFSKSMNSLQIYSKTSQNITIGGKKRHSLGLCLKDSLIHNMRQLCWWGSEWGEAMGYVEHSVRQFELLSTLLEFSIESETNHK